MKLSFALLLAGMCAAQEPGFEVASVKAVDPAHPSQRGVSGGPGTKDPSRYRNGYAILLDLIADAYGVQADQISGPAWLRDFAGQSHFEITATMPPETTKEQFRAMLRNLLAERFHLTVHHETRNFPGYNLVVAKGGPKIVAVTPAPVTDANDAPPQFGKRDKDGFPSLAPGPRVLSMVSAGKERIRYQEKSMADFAAHLGNMIRLANGAPLGSPEPRVVDKTGLTGVYTFNIEYSCAGCEGLSAAARASLPLLAGRGAVGGTEPDPAGDPGSGAPGLFAALEKQLGLRLEKASEVPVDIVVVDRLDKLPTAN